MLIEIKLQLIRNQNNLFEFVKIGPKIPFQKEFPVRADNNFPLEESSHDDRPGLQRTRWGNGRGNGRD